MSAQPEQRFAGFHIVADVTGRDMDEIHDALENLLCKHPDSKEPCAVEHLASTTHSDYDRVFQWVSGTSPNPGFVARVLSDDKPVWVDYAGDDLVAMLNSRLDADNLITIEVTRP